jgi:hypothetical protein
MGRVIAEISEWMFEGTDADAEVAARLFDSTGAFVRAAASFRVLR